MRMREKQTTEKKNVPPCYKCLRKSPKTNERWWGCEYIIYIFILQHPPLVHTTLHSNIYRYTTTHTPCPEGHRRPASSETIVRFWLYERSSLIGQCSITRCGKRGRQTGGARRVRQRAIDRTTVVRRPEHGRTSGLADNASMAESCTENSVTAIVPQFYHGSAIIYMDRHR